MARRRRRRRDERPVRLLTTIEDARLERVDLNQAQLPDIRISDAELIGCNLANVQARGGWLRRCELRGCRLTQSDWQEVSCDSVRFLSCDLTGSDMSGAHLRRSEFRRCELTDLRGIRSLRGAGMEWGDLIGMAAAFAAELGVRVLDAPAGQQLS